MSNDYYNNSVNTLAVNAVANASDVEGKFDEVVSAFDKLPAEADLVNNTGDFVTDTGAADAYVVTMPTTITSYTDGFKVSMRVANANTGASTLNADAVAVKGIKRPNGDALRAGDFASGMLVEMRWDDDNDYFVLISSTTGSNLINVDIKVGAAIDAAKIADGSVSSAEFQRLDGVTADIQGQINVCVKDTGNEAVAGIKTFSSSPIVPTPTTDMQASTKKHVDDSVPTNSETKTAYEANADTNAFTDALQTKLNGVEALADVTDATNVNAAGAVMNTGNEAVAGIKTFSSSPIVPTPTTDMQAATKKYVDDTIDSMVLLETKAASNDASIEFTSDIDSTYKEYEVHLINVLPATDATMLQIVTSTNAGVSYGTGASDYSYTISEGATSAGEPTKDFIRLTYYGTSSDANDLGVSGTFKLFNPSESVYVTMMFAGIHVNAAPTSTMSSVQMAGRRLAAANIDALKFYFASGNIESGIFKLYGIR